MSFDLFVLVDRFDQQVQSAWVERLREVGVSCTLPPGFALDAVDESTPPATCVIGPPLVAAAWSAQPASFAVEMSPVDADDVSRMRKGSDADLDRKLTSARIEFFFTTGAGRDDVSLLLQCYGAAALADVTQGVLLDPQEAGAVHGKAVYEVARANSDFVLQPARSSSPPTKSWWQRLLGM
ncbi:hypothetical protein [Tahibacter amnicola]|uniref:DJ-1/PfpI family protein n=1 Tax=Tahibacter amnicola TaxID=2976241 RepID=A0ABY6BGA0_9GAMM|nr:hypothetical protein [Tahibacter amnicola]UXI68105.1 hypothetical protein N4264_00170 [Tahibacter amnicola]